MKKASGRKFEEQYIQLSIFNKKMLCKKLKVFYLQYKKKVFYLTAFDADMNLTLLSV